MHPLIRNLSSCPWKSCIAVIAIFRHTWCISSKQD